MLVLSRRRGEVVVIRVGREVIRVTTVDIRGEKCRLGFEASKEVLIDRLEVDDAKQRPKVA